VRENGGQYTHAAVWSVIAFAMLGEGDEAAELLRILNPINRKATRTGAYAYKVDPYVLAADIYADSILICADNIDEKEVSWLVRVLYGNHFFIFRRSVMNIISLIVVLVVVGLLLWLVNNYIPMEARIKQILNIVVVIMVVIWILNAVGVMGMLPAPLISVLVTLVVVGLLLWLVNSYIPMEGSIKQILNIVVIILVVLWLLSVFGILSGIPSFRIGNP